jgi:dTDP-4-dehydrorhamnose reductase
MKAAIIAANGQLGVDLCRVLTTQKIAVVPLTHRDLDVSDSTQVDQVLGAIRPDVVLSTAAFHKVDECETQPALSFAVNAVGPRNLAAACSRNNSVLVHFSTDYVFDGKQRRPYTESDLPGPLNVYGVSKLAGECMIPFTCARHFIIRTCGLYGLAGSKGKGGNFVEIMLKKASAGTAVRVVNDQVLTPTSTEDLAEVVGQIIHTDAYGLYHVSAEGECSWHEFAHKIFEMENLAADLKPISTAEFYSPVQRPAYSVLSKQKLTGIGLSMPKWEDALARYLVARRAETRQTAATPA